MNGYQRIKSALSGVMPDRRPVMLHNFMLAAREAGYMMRQYRDDPEIAAKCHIQFAEKYGVDGILFDVDTALTAGAVGVKVDFPEDEPARTHEAFLTSLDEIDSLADIDISTNPRIQHSVESIKILKRYFGNELFIRGNCDQAPFSLACCMRTPADFMIDLMLDEERSIQLLEYTTKICKQFIRLMADAGSDMVSNGDSPAGPSMISPEMYEQFALPYEKAMLDEARQKGVPYLLHICGNTDLILGRMASIGLDAVELDYKTSVEAIHTHFSSSTTLFGTVDPSGVLALGSPESVIEETEKILQVYKDSPYLVIGAGCAIPPMAPEENIRALIRVAQQYN
ncbi:MAG: uroporphyrinogen decarboxylase family protein [Bacteroidales bacterium]|nr:uroporphyrinogen decarboxylase family protein [Bacteroidales bacterium]